MRRYSADYDGQTIPMMAADITRGDIVMGTILAGRVTFKQAMPYGYRFGIEYNDGTADSFGSKPSAKWNVVRSEQ
jgi:hypothetical protein